MAVHATLDRRSGARARFFVLSRPQWIMGFLVLLLAALGAWQALQLERAGREGVAGIPDEAVPALVMLTPSAGRRRRTGSGARGGGDPCAGRPAGRV